VHGQDVLGGQSTRLAVPTPTDGQPVVDGLHLQRRQLLERPSANMGSDVVAEQRGVLATVRARRVERLGTSQV
jgi:hypothetical protein